MVREEKTLSLQTKNSDNVPLSVLSVSTEARNKSYFYFLSNLCTLNQNQVNGKKICLAGYYSKSPFELVSITFFHNLFPRFAKQLTLSAKNRPKIVKIDGTDSTNYAPKVHAIGIKSEKTDTLNYFWSIISMRDDLLTKT